MFSCILANGCGFPQEIASAEASDGAWAQGYDVMEEMYNAKTAAMNFVHEVCKVRAKGNLADFMSICVGVMNEYKVTHLSSNLPRPAGATHL